jgi:indole-3-glycerol phosphate synthase
MSVLSEILADKRTEVEMAKRRAPIGELQRRVRDVARPRDFVKAISDAPRPALICEIKKASPSKGIIRYDFDPVEIAKTYEANGATCLSVLTDERHFHGNLTYLSDVRSVVGLPLLRKDFIIDEYQLLEARVAGADAVLLIMAALGHAALLDMIAGCRALGMAAIVEVHDGSELEDAIRTPANLIGINNRDLHLFRTTLQTTLDLMPSVPSDRLVVSESGINTRTDVVKLARAGVSAVLVGEAFMRADDIGAKVRELAGRGVS